MNYYVKLSVFIIFEVVFNFFTNYFVKKVSFLLRFIPIIKYQIQQNQFNFIYSEVYN